MQLLLLLLTYQMYEQRPDLSHSGLTAFTGCNCCGPNYALDEDRPRPDQRMQQQNWREVDQQARRAADSSSRSDQTLTARRQVRTQSYNTPRTDVALAISSHRQLFPSSSLRRSTTNSKSLSRTCLQLNNRAYRSSLGRSHQTPVLQALRYIALVHGASLICTGSGEKAQPTHVS